MLDIIARLLIALAVAAGAQGVGTAGDHAAGDGNDKALGAIEAVIARLSAVVDQAQALAGAPETTGLDRALEVADEHAAVGLARAADARAAAAARAEGAAPVVAAPPIDTPPVDTPAADGPPAALPPVAAPPVPAPPIAAPGMAQSSESRS